MLGDTLYVPDSWDELGPDERAILLRHERVHLRQRRRYGTVGMALIYLLPIFPLGLAYGRARIEWEAYQETLRATLEHKGRTAVRDPLLRDRIVARFTGPAYGWMWPFPARCRALVRRLPGASSSGKAAAGKHCGPKPDAPAARLMVASPWNFLSATGRGRPEVEVLALFSRNDRTVPPWTGRKRGIAHPVGGPLEDQARV